MRLGFLNTNREAFRSAGARVRIGRADGNDLVLGTPGVAERHLAIAEDRRGLVLEVLPGAQHVYVNARPVRERALLRYGDVLSVGGCKLSLLAEETARDGAAPRPLARDAAPRPGFAAMRVVSGAWSGRLLPIEGKLTLGGRGFALPGLPECELKLDEAGLRLEMSHAQVSVNGVPRKRAMLQPGDQLTLGENRFVVEAPGLQAAVLAAQELEDDPLPIPAAFEPRHSRAELWWLLGTAAILAATIAVLLWWKH